MRTELDVSRPDSERVLTPSHERELGVIITNMWQNAEHLLRVELELGLAELDLRTEKLKRGLLMATIGGATLYAGILVLLAAVVLGLSKVMEPWLSALLVGGVITGIGVTLSMRGEEKAVEAVEPDQHAQSTTRVMKEAIK